MANHKDRVFMFNGKKMLCRCGQFVSGRKALSEKTGIDENKIYRLLNLFEKERLIEQRKNNVFTLVSIFNYAQYQQSEQQVNNGIKVHNTLNDNGLEESLDGATKKAGKIKKDPKSEQQDEQSNDVGELYISEQQNEQPVNNQRTTSEQRVNTNKHYKALINIKKNVYGGFKEPTLEEVKAYANERNSVVIPQIFLDFYASKGWMVGKNKMKDWKAAFRNAEGWDRWYKNEPNSSKEHKNFQHYLK